MTVTRQGRAFLVGAGPGSSGLLTLRALECIRTADLIVLDRLISDSIRSLIPTHVRRISLAELPGCHADKSRQIIATIIEAARAGQTVVRLKSGDPCLFGRGGEEASALAAAGIPFEIVPGVTAALGACAYAGISLTHRDQSSGVVFVTGHEATSRGSPSVDWSWLAQFSGTLVVYMGMCRIQTIVDLLLAGGKPPQTPSAAIQEATTGRQRSIRASLSELPGRVAAAGLTAPAIIVIGEVARQTEELAWFEQAPLLGRRVLIPRPLSQGQELGRELERLGAIQHLLPAIEIRPPLDWAEVDRGLSRLGEFDWLVFTSVHGVDALLCRIWARGGDLRTLGHLRLAAIGPSTAARLEHYHLKADLIPPEYRSEAFATSLAPVVAGKRILLARADRGRNLLREELSKVAVVEQIAVYRQLDVEFASDCPAWQALSRGEMDWIALTSSNIARSVLRQLPPTAANLVRAGRMKIASISPVTTVTVRELGFDPTTEAAEFTINGLIEALVAYEEGKQIDSASRAGT